MTPLTLMPVWTRLAAATLVAAAWQGAALALLAWTVLRLTPKVSAAVRYAVWFGVFIVVAALPVVLAGHALHGTDASRQGHAAWLTLGTGWSLAIAAVWLAASLVRAVTLIAAAVRLRTLWTRARPVERKRPDGTSRAGRLATVCVSDEVDRPSVIGFFAPRILMPGWLIDQLTPAELEQIVLHEAGHLDRADDWLNLLQKLALVIFPLNPALVWLERRLCFERELACDERVLHATGAPKAYAACLANLAEYRLGRRGGSLSLALGMAGARGRESELGQRIGSVLAGQAATRPMQAKLVLGGAFATLLLGAAALERSPQLVEFAGPETTVAQTAPSECGAASLQNVTFHVEAPLGRSAWDAANRNKVMSKAAEAMGARAAYAAFHGHSRTANLVSTSLPPAGRMRTVPVADRPGARWLVVTTAWDAAGNSRLYVETLSVTNPEPAGPARTVRTEASPMPESIFPVAAVPVRDGWLVLQM